MARRSIDPEIDRLYQLPLGDFVAERNALAKRAGDAAAEVRGLQKPTVPAWAVNQLYWQKRPVYDELIERGNDLRATHNAALRRRAADLRGAARAHEEAIEHALKTTIELLEASGSSVTEATRQAIATTLRSLPSAEAAGRLTRQLEPRGFEVLGGPAEGRVRVAPPAARPAKKEARAANGSERDAARIAAARETATAAAKSAREAEQLVRREEFEAARATREAEKAERRLTQAEQALEEAREELDAARQGATAAAKARDSARSRAAKAAADAEAAQLREQSARKQLDALE
jgi:hypothetical protein